MLVAGGPTMTEAEWLTCENPEPMLESLRGEASDRNLRLFACVCHKEVLRYKPRDPDDVLEQKQWIEATERFVDGGVSPDEWEAVRAGRTNTLHAHSHACSAAREAVFAAGRHNWPLGGDTDNARRTVQERRLADLLRDIFGNPFRPVAFDPAWRTSTVLSLASQMYESRDFGAMPILADALQDAGCDCDDVLAHCRGSGPHVRGCWVVDLVLGKT
jgi:hypothetical protein